jgi:hypothetical protein
MFPFKTSGQLPATILSFQRDPVQQVLDKLEEIISVERPARLSRGRDYLEFRSGIDNLLFSGRSVLWGIAGGRLEVHNPAGALFVRYRLSFMALWGWSLAVLIISIVLQVWEGDTPSPTMLSRLAGFLLVLVIIVTTSGIIRFRNMVKKAVQGL